MASRRNLPFRTKYHISSLTSSIISTSQSTARTDVPSSSDSISTVDSVWDDAPVPLQYRPSSPATPATPATPPCDDEEMRKDENFQYEASPLAHKSRHPRHFHSPRPSLIRSGPEHDSDVDVVGTLSFSRSRQTIDGAVFGPTTIAKDGLKINSASLASGVDRALDESSHAADPPEAGVLEEEFESDTEAQQTEVPSRSIKHKAAKLKSKFPKLRSLKTGDKIDAEAKKARSSKRDDHKRSRFSMPGSWHQEPDSSGPSPTLSEDEYHSERATQDQDARKSAKPRPGDESPEQIPKDGTPAKETTSNAQTKKRGRPSNSLDENPPEPPTFLPYHKKPDNINEKTIFINEKLHRLFGGVDVKKADKARRTPKKGTDESEGIYLPWIISRQDNPPIGDGYGHLYMFESPQRPGFIKIGMTTQPVTQRKSQWKNQCRLDFEIIDQPHDKPFYNFDLVEQIIHIELYEERRTFKCGTCSARHNDPLKNTEWLRKDPKRKYKGYVSHGEWFEISKEEAIKVAHKWRQWAAPDSRRHLSYGTGWTWQRLLKLIVDGRQILSDKILITAPYDRNRRLSGCWVRRYHHLTSDFQNISWEKWREPPGWIEVGVEFLDFVSEKFKSSYSEGSQLGFSTRAAIFWNEKVVKNGIALALLMLPFIVVVLCWKRAESIWGICFGMILNFAYFVAHWLHERR